MADAVRRLGGLPVNMTYNLTMVDARGAVATTHVSPGREPQVSTCPVATNHRGATPDDPEHARRSASVDRRDALLSLLDTDPEPLELAAALLRPPLNQTGYDRAFGTLYTALYRPQLGHVDYLWPDTSWRRTFDSPDATRTVVLRSR